jgi:hypothetical protein
MRIPNKIDFGQVEIGIRKEISVTIENDTNATVTELQFNVDPEIKIESSPVELEPHAKAILKLSWIPSLDLKQPLDTSIMIKGKEVYKNE